MLPKTKSDNVQTLRGRPKNIDEVREVRQQLLRDSDNTLTKELEYIGTVEESKNQIDDLEGNTANQL